MNFCSTAPARPVLKMKKSGETAAFSMAVSYTHLDVYKRQAAAGKTAAAPTEAAAATAGAAALLGDGLLQLRHGMVYAVAVSYTHLDVYKRQAKALGVSTSFFSRAS